MNNLVLFSIYCNPVDNKGKNIRAPARSKSTLLKIGLDYLFLAPPGAFSFIDFCAGQAPKEKVPDPKRKLA
ncbi:MAG: hypothetical protein KAS16_07195 [Thermoplasmata archaeon]|nr:hypothetical protein [Thermoplasmata archaeon]